MSNPYGYYGGGFQPRGLGYSLSGLPGGSFVRQGGFQSGGDWSSVMGSGSSRQSSRGYNSRFGVGNQSSLWDSQRRQADSWLGSQRERYDHNDQYY